MTISIAKSIALASLASSTFQDSHATSADADRSIIIPFTIDESGQCLVELHINDFVTPAALRLNDLNVLSYPGSRNRFSSNEHPSPPSLKLYTKGPHVSAITVTPRRSYYVEHPHDNKLGIGLNSFMLDDFGVIAVIKSVHRHRGELVIGSSLEAFAESCVEGSLGSVMFPKPLDRKLSGRIRLIREGHSNYM